MRVELLSATPGHAAKLRIVLIPGAYRGAGGFPERRISGGRA